ncbi:MAG: hypothetical protein V1865_02380 [bacterium]
MCEVLIVNKGKKLNPAQDLMNKDLFKKGYFPINVFGMDDAIGYFLRIRKPMDIVLSEYSNYDYGEYFKIFKDRIGNIATIGIGPRIIKNGHIDVVVDECQVRKTMILDGKKFSFIDWREVLKNFK